MSLTMTQDEAQLLAERYLRIVWRTNQTIFPLPSEENVFAFTLRTTMVIKVREDVLTIEDLTVDPPHVRVVARRIHRPGHTAWYAKLHHGEADVYCVRLEDGMVFVLSCEEYPD